MGCERRDGGVPPPLPPHSKHPSLEQMAVGVAVSVAWRSHGPQMIRRYLEKMARSLLTLAHWEQENETEMSQKMREK